jgi:hypothetical protein
MTDGHVADRIIAVYMLSNLQNGYHPLYEASFYGNLECVELLLNHNAQIDLPEDVSYHCNMYYQCSLAMHMTVSLMYVCIPLIFMFVTHAGSPWLHSADCCLSRRPCRRH